MILAVGASERIAAALPELRALRPEPRADGRARPCV
jgi:hypothetical protein